MIKNTRKQSGTVSVEYALMISLTAIGLIVAIGLMTGEMSNLFASIKESVSSIKNVVQDQIKGLIYNISRTSMSDDVSNAINATGLPTGVTADDYEFMEINGTLGEFQREDGTIDSFKLVTTGSGDAAVSKWTYQTPEG